MKVLILAISYNSNEALNNFLDSIEIAMENNSDVDLKVIVGEIIVKITVFAYLSDTIHLNVI